MVIARVFCSYFDLGEDSIDRFVAYVQKWIGLSVELYSSNSEDAMKQFESKIGEFRDFPITEDVLEEFCTLTLIDTLFSYTQW